MSRGFMSGGGTGGKKNGGSGKKFGSSLSGNRPQTREDLMNPNSHAPKTKSYGDMLDDLIDEKMFSDNPNKHKFSLSGTQAQEDREMTKGMKAAMEMAKQQRAKKRKKSRGKGVDIIAKSFGMGPDGGRIDKEGRIMNAQGQVMLKVDPNTGIITDNMGMKVGKYNAHSMVNETKIENLIKKYSAQKATTNPFAAKE